jgi:ribosomal protein S12 methylthiotransferase
MELDRPRRTVGLVALGCPKNLVDAELMLGQLEERGYTLTPDARAAEVVLVNTCSFIGPAREESVQVILEAARLKQSGSCRLLLVTGCLAQQHAPELAKELPEVDAFVGVSEFPRLGEIIDAAWKGQRPIAVAPPTLPYQEYAPRRLATPPWTAYLKIAEGCDCACTFCAIPAIRGRFRSRRPEAILAEAERLAAQGVRELNLIAEDTTHYGVDLECRSLCFGAAAEAAALQRERPGVRSLLPDLLRALAQVDEIAWLRLLYCYPTKVHDELIEVIATEPKVCAYLDVPMQHGDDDVLRAMGRAGRRAGYLRLIARLRAAIPDVAIRSAFIVGFPGERRAHFENLRDFVREAELDRVGFFAYSPEPDTPAAELPHPVPPQVIQRRLEELAEVQRMVSRQRQERWVGRRMRVLIEGPLPGGEEREKREGKGKEGRKGDRGPGSGDRGRRITDHGSRITDHRSPPTPHSEGRFLWHGRSFRDAPGIDGVVVCESSRPLIPGTFVDVQIEQASDHDLRGRVVEEGTI